MNPNDIDLESAAQAQADLAQKQYQARVDFLHKRALQSAKLKGEAAKKVVVYDPLGEHRPTQPKFMPPKKTFSFRIEAFRSENEKAEIYTAIVEGSGANLIEATADATEKLRKGVTEYKRLGS
jgi:hypothetical protein